MGTFLPKVQNRWLNLNINLTYIYIFLKSACILHEIGHLIIRWQGLEKSPPQIREAGFFIETRLFGGRIAIAFHKENLNNTSKYFSI